MLESFGIASLLLPLGAALGWYLAKRSARISPDQAPGLAGAMPGAETDATDEAPFESEILKGTLCRQRGEVDRALRIHEALAGRAGLGAAQEAEARFELAQDYVKAGMFDRAETLLAGLLAEPAFLVEAAQMLATLHEQAHDWLHAAETLRRLQAAQGQSRAPTIAQYLCERAEQLRGEGDRAGALALAAEALREDPRCVRASLLRGALLEQDDRAREAIAEYRHVAEQDVRFLSEALPALERCHQAAGDADGFWQYLQDLETLTPNLAPTLAKVRLMQQGGADPAVHLARRVAGRPGWEGMRALLASLPAPDSSALAEGLAAVREGVDKLLAQRPRFRCSHCGLQARMLFWQCPSCRTWGAVLPAEETAG